MFCGAEACVRNLRFCSPTSTGYCLTSLRLGVDCDLPSILACPLQSNLQIPLANEARKLLSPLDQQNAALRAQIVETERLQLSRGVDTVKIDVVKIGARAAILVDEREGGAGNVVFVRRLESGSNSLHQRGLSRSEIAAQQHQLGRRKRFCQTASESNRFLRRMRGDLAGHRVAPATQRRVGGIASYPRPV